MSLGLSNTALADTAQAVADRFADVLPTKVYSADWSEKYTNTLAPSRLWGGQHTEAFEATQRAAQSIARSLGPAPDWSERFAKALDTRYGAGWSPLAAWRPHSTALDAMLSTAVPADLPALGGLREPLELREALLRRAEPARTLEEAASLARVIDDPPLLADQLEAYRCGHVEGRNVSARRTEVATWITAGLTAVTAGLTAVLVHADPYVQKHLINDLHRWLQSLGG